MKAYIKKYEIFRHYPVLNPATNRVEMAYYRDIYSLLIPLGRNRYIIYLKGFPEVVRRGVYYPYQIKNRNKTAKLQPSVPAMLQPFIIEIGGGKTLEDHLYEMTGIMHLKKPEKTVEIEIDDRQLKLLEMKLGQYEIETRMASKQLERSRKRLADIADSFFVEVDSKST